MMNRALRNVVALTIALLVTSVSMLAGEKVKSITPTQAQKLIKSAKVVVLDVRTPAEYRSGHLVNAILVDYYEKNFLENVMKLDKELPVVVYCARGRRSEDATNIMVNNGFKKVYNVLGGFERWSAESLPSVR